MTQLCDSINHDTIYVTEDPLLISNSISRPKSTKMADNSFATADLSEAIKGLDSIECGAEARKHFPTAKSYRNFNHGMFEL
jgi:hypothetical protein